MCLPQEAEEEMFFSLKLWTFLWNILFFSNYSFLQSSPQKACPRARAWPGSRGLQVWGEGDSQEEIQSQEAEEEDDGGPQYVWSQ